MPFFLKFRSSKRRVLTPEAEKHKPSWPLSLFRKLRNGIKKRKNKRKRPDIIHLHRDPRTRRRFVSHSPLPDPFVDVPGEGYPLRAPETYLRQGPVQVPSWRPSQERFASRVVSTSETRFANQPHTIRLVPSSIGSSHRSLFQEDLLNSAVDRRPQTNHAVRPTYTRPPTPLFPSIRSDSGVVREPAHLRTQSSPVHDKATTHKSLQCSPEKDFNSVSHQKTVADKGPCDRPPPVFDFPRRKYSFETSAKQHSSQAHLDSTRSDLCKGVPKHSRHSKPLPPLPNSTERLPSKPTGYKLGPNPYEAGEDLLIRGEVSQRARFPHLSDSSACFGAHQENRKVKFVDGRLVKSTPTTPPPTATFPLPSSIREAFSSAEYILSIPRIVVSSTQESNLSHSPYLQQKRQPLKLQPPIMAAPRVSQFLDPSSAMATLTKQKVESIKLAREQAAAVDEMCRRAKTEVPPYEFEELIGKGAYGRVYKGRQLPSRDLVAIKVMDIDNLDYKMNRDMKDESIKDFIHEIKAMNQAKESGSKNINMLIEAISIHSQLWVVCEYCPGGSVKTLMRATGDKLEEKFIIPIARELASGLRAIHDAGIIHRDVKAGNILIHEEGRLQICDFGVAGILQSNIDKRSTWIGTPHWMPPEMFATRGEAHQYGSELDVWAYGCTLFEFATGNPPNAGLRERMQIGRSLGRNTPKLEGDNYSQELKNLVSFSLNSDPFTRPTMATILDHPYLADSETDYPTKSLSELVRIYYQWSQSGGQRMSLFHPGGAAAAEFPENYSPIEENWNFSTTNEFGRRHSVIDWDEYSASLAKMTGDELPVPQKPEPFLDDTAIPEMTDIERANFDERVKRGAAAMEGLFDEQKPSYKYETKNDFIPIEEKLEPVHSDLPLRTTTDRSSVTSTFIDINLGSFDSAHYAAGSASQFQLADADTIRANRSSLRSGRNSDGDQTRGRYEVGGENHTFQPNAPRPPTMDWKFPTMVVPEDEEPEASSSSPIAAMEPFIPPAEDKRATRDWKFPVMGDARDETVSYNDNGYTYDEIPSHTIRPMHAQSHQSQQSVTLDLDLAHSHNVSVDGIDAAAITRPSTAASTMSDYDPFRFDRSPDIPQPTAHRRMVSKAPSLLSNSSLDEGPGPDHEDDVITGEDGDGPGPDEEEEEEVPELTPNATAITSMNAQMALSQASYETGRPHSQNLQFPDVQPPSAESLLEDAPEDVVVGEMDRLIDGLMQACHSAINVLENVE